MYEAKKNGKVFSSKFVGTGPASYKKRIYRSAASKILRNTALDYVMSEVSKNSAGIRRGLCGKLTNLVYTDDICLLAHSTLAMQTMLERRREAAKVGL
jgi:hypothetical protein